MEKVRGADKIVQFRMSPPSANGQTVVQQPAIIRPANCPSCRPWRTLMLELWFWLLHSLHTHFDPRCDLTVLFIPVSMVITVQSHCPRLFQLLHRYNIDR